MLLLIKQESIESRFLAVYSSTNTMRRIREVEALKEGRTYCHWEALSMSNTLRRRYEPGIEVLIPRYLRYRGPCRGGR